MKQPKHTLLIIIGFIFLQVAIRAGFNYTQGSVTESFGINPIMQQWAQGKYKTISEQTAQTASDMMRKQAALLKMGQINIWTGLISSGGSGYPQRRTNIIKAGYLKDKNNPEGADSLLSDTIGKDKAIGSLLLGLRAKLFCDQKKWLECGLLADDSIRLDPVAPLGRGLRGISMRQQKLYADSKKAFDQYLGLSGYHSQDISFFRGIANYYTRNRDISTGELESVQYNPQYGFEAIIFLGRNYFDLKEYVTSIDRFTKALSVKGSGSVLPYLWLGRIHYQQKNYTEALLYYNSGYAFFPNNIELISDMMLLGKTTNNTALLNEMKNAATYAVGTNLTSMEILARTYRTLREFDVAEQYARQGIALLPAISNPLLAQEQSKALFNQLHHLIIQTIFNNLKNNISSEK